MPLSAHVERRTNTSEYKKLHYRDRDENLYNSWKETVGEENVPDSLDKFQESRYNDIVEWERLKRERTSITEINGKTWTPTFKEKAVNNYYELRDGGVDIFSHGVARMIDRGVSVDSVIEQSHRPFNYTESNGKKLSSMTARLLFTIKKGRK